MPTWHQERPGKPLPKLTHPTKWRSYNPTGHLSVMTHDSQHDCVEYCKRTGDVPLPPDNYQAQVQNSPQAQDHPHNNTCGETDELGDQPDALSPRG